MMGAASTAISDPPPSTPGPSHALKRTQPPNRPALSSTPAPTAHPRKPKSKNVPSRYLSPSPSPSTSSSSITTTGTTTTTTTSSSSSSRRFTSPLLSRSTNSAPSPSPALKRSQSVDRRRPSTARPTTPVTSGNSGGGEVSAAAKLLITSTRSLSVSFQGEAFSLPVSKAKKAATPDRRRATPTPVRDQGENSKPTDQQTHRWPGRTRQANSSSNLNSLSRSVDYSRINDEKRKLIGFGSGSLSKLLQQSMIDESSNGRRMSFDGRLSLDLGKVFLKGVPQASDANSLNESNGNCDLTASDTDSVSSGSTNGLQECGWTAKPKSGPRGILMSARFWQETNSRLRRLQDPGSPLSTSPGSRIDKGANKLSQSKRFSSDSPLGPSRTMASPVRGAMRPASPSKLWASTDSSPSRGMPSPSRVRPNSTSLSANSCAMPSILSFSMDVRRGKIGEDRIVEAHLLRLLYNRHLQWRFVNARADAAFSVQRLSAEKNLWNAWVTISELRHTVSLKRMKLLLLRQKLKLTSILKGQIAFLDEWSLLDKEHTSSFLGATEALRASTLRLPVVGKATADVTNLKDAMGSAVDVMQAMTSSIRSLSSKVEEVNSLVAELVNVSVKERLSLDQCRDFLSGLAALQVKDCSLRTHTLQLHRVLPTP